MDEFDHRGEFEPRRPVEARRGARHEVQRRAQALAAAGDDVLCDLPDQHHIRLQALADQRIDAMHVRRDGAEERGKGQGFVLDTIEDYNRIDCFSTEELRDWLVGIRPAGPWPLLVQDASHKETSENSENGALRALLTASELPQETQDMLRLKRQRPS